MTSQDKLRRVAVILCLIPALYCFLTAGYALFHFGDFAAGTPHLIRYVIAPMGLAAILMASAYFLTASSALMVGLNATAILVALFAFEIYTTVRLLPRQMGLVGVVDDSVSLDRYERAMPPAYTLKALNQQRGIESVDQAVLSSVPGEDVFLCSRDGKLVSYRADSYGFRNPGQSVGFPVDMLVLGDSFMEGICLEDGQHTVDRLRRADPSIVNTASRGAGPLFELAVLGRFGPHFRPRVTLMVFFAGNDWENLEGEAGLPWLQDVLDPATDFGPVAWTEDQRSQTEEIIGRWWQETAASPSQFFRRRSFLRNLFALQQTAGILGLHYPKSMQPNPDYERVLHRASEIVDGWDGKLVVVYVPSVDRYSGIFDHKFAHEPLRHMVLEAASDAEVPVIDLTTVFEMQPDPKSFYAPDAHFSATGASMAAGAIQVFLEEFDSEPQ